MTRQATILVVEDEPLLLMMYEDAIQDAGQTAIACDNLADGLGAATTGVDVAILDIRLGSDFAFPIAHRLLALGIPFLFASGTVEDMPLGAFVNVPLMRKPVSAQVVVEKALSILRHDQDSCAA